MKAIVFADTRSVMVTRLDGVQAGIDAVGFGRARPGVVVTHHGHLDDAPALYQQFDQRANGVIKAVLCP